MKLPPNNRWKVFAVIGMATYPLVVYFGLKVVPPAVIVLFGVTLIALRMVVLSKAPGVVTWIGAFAAAIFALLALMVYQPQMAVKSYPVVLSLATAAVFGLSLRFPPSLIERIARAQEPSLSSEALPYLRQLTGIWACVLVANAAISAATALWGSLDVWTLWNGCLSYVALGALFFGERILRPWLTRSRELRP